MSSPFVAKAAVWQGSDCLLLARGRAIIGTNPPTTPYMSQSNIVSIALTVYDVTNGMTVVVGPIALVVSQVVYNTLQPNDGVLWTADQIGYNFLYRLAGVTAFPAAHVYKVDVIFTTTDGTVYPLQYQLTATPVP